MENTSMDLNNRFFVSEYYPEEVKEINHLKTFLENEPIYFKVEIVISFLRYHSLRNEWIEANPSLAKLITSGIIKMSRLEMLFASGNRSSQLLRSLEEYITRQLLRPSAFHAHSPVY